VVEVGEDLCEDLDGQVCPRLLAISVPNTVSFSRQPPKSHYIIVDTLSDG
jgi:hypothetical protein